jgi:hypothetical protein
MSLDDFARFVSDLLHPLAGSLIALEETKQVIVDPGIKLYLGQSGTRKESGLS